jgi:hypothetical protein
LKLVSAENFEDKLFGKYIYFSVLGKTYILFSDDCGH